MCKQSLVHCLRNFLIRSCKFSSHLQHGPQATSTKAKRKKMRRGDIMIQIITYLLSVLSAKLEYFKHTKLIGTMLVTRGALDLGDRE